MTWQAPHAQGAGHHGPALHGDAVGIGGLDLILDGDADGLLGALGLDGHLFAVYLGGVGLDALVHLGAAIGQDLLHVGHQGGGGPGGDLDAEAAEQLILVVDHG